MNWEPQGKGCGKKREGDGKRRRTIAREGVGGGEREEEREGDMLLGLSPQTKNAGYVPVQDLRIGSALQQPGIDR